MFFYFFSDNSNVSLTASDNVFHEKLGKLKVMQQGMYIPNNAQIQSFQFDRAGLNVKVQVSNLYLIPTYIDLDHEDELDFLMKDNFQNQSSKDFYGAIRKDFCR